MGIRRILLFLATLLSITVHAQHTVVETAHGKHTHPLASTGTSGRNEVTDSVTVSLKILFGISKTTIDSTFYNNNASLAEFVSKMKTVSRDPTCRICDIEIACSASPDGHYKLNLMLSKNRGKALAKYLSKHIGISPSVFRINSKGEDWEGFRRLVSQSNMIGKEEVLSILDAHPDNISDEGKLSAWRKQMLHGIDDGKAWKYLRENIFPKLRAADNNIVCHFTRVQPQPVDVQLPETQHSKVMLSDTQPSIRVVHDTVVVRDTVYLYTQRAVTARLDHSYGSAPKSGRERTLYIKTNAVGLAMLVVNAAAEYQFHRNWSVCLPVYWSGWDYLRFDRKFRCLLVQPELRYWGLPAKGLFVGVHAGTGWYNYTMPGMDYRYQDKNGSTPLLNAGLSIGYRHSIGSSQRWMVEYSIGGGYVSTSYDRFFNVFNGQFFDTHSKNLFLIDQVNVSLVYHLQFKKKGGMK